MLLYILLPCYNADKTIGRAIDSVLPQLGESIRLLIINDGSKDNSKLIIQKYLHKSPYIEYLEQENQWLSSALWKGISYLQDKIIEKVCYVARLDSDDEYTPTGALDIFKTIKSEGNQHFCYLAGLLDENNQALTKFLNSPKFFSKGENMKKAVIFLDSVSSILNLQAFKNPKYHYDKVPARAWDGIPAMRIQRDFGAYLTNLYFYKVHFEPYSLSRRLITPEYAEIAFETNLILLNEFLLPSPDTLKQEIGDKYLILARYAAILKKYLLTFSYLQSWIQYHPKNLLYIGLVFTCLLPNGYKIVNFFIKHFLFKKTK